MTGRKETTFILNNTLIQIVKLLNDNNINDWFICYGTLLGLIRENNCIDRDDDIDIIIHKSKYNIVKDVLITNNFTLMPKYINCENILKTNPIDNKYSSIDIYMSDYGETHVFDLWNKLKITDCFLDTEHKTFCEMQWNGHTLYIPNNPVKILENRYGKDWRIKKDKKIPQRMTSL